MTPVLVLYAKGTDFENQKGEQVQFASIEYLDLEQTPDNHLNELEKGLTVFKSRLELEALKQFPHVPGFYHLSYRRVRDTKGNQSLAVAGGQFVKPFDTPGLRKLAEKPPQAVASSNK